MKLWIKTFSNEKIQLNQLIKSDLPLTKDTLHSLLMDLKDDFDLPLPVISQINISNLVNFHITKFIQRDFMEKIHFDFLEISYIPK